MGQDLLMENTQPIETGAYARRRVRVNLRSSWGALVVVRPYFS
jgi:hypothetical protein